MKITYIGYDISTLQYDLGPGEVIDTDRITPPADEFNTIDDVLRFACEKLGTEFRKDDWCFEEDLDEKGNDGWVLHIIVDEHNKFATHEMIEAWRNGDLVLRDLLVNVFAS